MKNSWIGILSIVSLSGTLLAQLPVPNRALITSVATPLGTTRAEARKFQQDSETMLRMEVAYQGLAEVSFAGDPNEELARSASEALASCHWSMEKLRQLDGKAPNFEKLAGQTLLATPGLYKSYNKEQLTSSESGLRRQAGQHGSGGRRVVPVECMERI